MKGSEVISYRTPDTPYTQAYWRRLLQNQVSPRRHHEQPESKKATVTIERQSIPSTIRLTCGCFATAITGQDGFITKLIPHHVHGCTGEKD